MFITFPGQVRWPESPNWKGGSLASPDPTRYLWELEVQHGVLGAEVGELPDPAARGCWREEAREGEEVAALPLGAPAHDVAALQARDGTRRRERRPRRRWVASLEQAVGEGERAEAAALVGLGVCGRGGGGLLDHPPTV